MFLSSGNVLQPHTEINQLVFFRQEENHLKVIFMFGEKIKAFGKGQFGSVKGLAEAMGMLPQQLSTYISEVKKPGFDVLAKLKGLGCDMNWLIDENSPIGDVSATPGSSPSVPQLSDYELLKLRAVLRAHDDTLKEPRSKKTAG